jgi:hypothetical protein
MNVFGSSQSFITEASGVGHRDAIVTSVGPPACARLAWFRSAPASESHTRAVGHREDEDAVALVRRADLCRAE